MSALVERFPALAGIAATHSKVVRDADGRALDLDLGAGRLYNGDGREIAGEQVARFNERPLQFFTADLSSTNIGSPVSARMRAHLIEALGGLGIATLNSKPDYEGTFLVVLGIGLGHHLKPLFETTKARHVLLCEPMAEFIAHARDEQDWDEILAIADARGISVRFSIGATPSDLLRDIRALIALVGEPFIDGAYVFMHYPSWVLIEARDQMQAIVDQIFLSKGFFEDELLMMTNAVGNMQRYDFHLADSKPKLARKETAIITGSGPSIDGTMDDLKRLAADGAVFSAGTSLRICLRNGIRPDFHCELENGHITYEVLKRLHDEHGLAGITLIASFTVDPKVAALFDKVIFFFRDSVSSSQMLAPPRHAMVGVAPTCVNTALRVAASFGFTDFVLFGTDCGSKNEDRKHSQDTIYNAEDFFRNHDRRQAYNHILPGNFGGTVSANWVFALCASMIGDVASAFRLNVLNTADGARLRGTQPRVAAAIRTIGKVADRARLQQDIERLTRPYRAGEFLDSWSGSRLRDEAGLFFADLIDIVDAAIAEGDDLVGFWNRLSPFLGDLAGRYAETHSIAIGSIRSLPKIGMYFAHRVTAPEKRAKLVTIFLQEYREIVLTMRDGTFDLLSHLDDRIEAALPAALPPGTVAGIEA
ncbi:motility associated factor glycosyltransferase family protein [Zavarzinia compransoris]|uniref:DUF115 domain-containing protein n=1 Tax=Zavarzinia compransoris TaxID=1264899 RepID=A0A317E326_9PROT|nr:6-hydroxymethylpterin diphosphokinase MptE-like protein [Zavarzinia compransoris]PWR19783.1 hypothetical protein DKG75_15085 [Zavarzinia compransoris]TDP45113.1 uncharacterized protein DUF115 [Zavarzinia compransoris]